MKTKILLSLFVVLVFASCLEDEGNYDLNDLNTATITSFVKGNATIGEPYIITPVIDYKGLSEDDFEYFWYANESGGATSDTLSYKKDLSFVFTKAGWYLAYFHIKNKKTGGITSQMFDFNVISRYQKGWMILSEKDNKSILSYSREISDKVIDASFVDIYNTLYGASGQLGTKPLSLGRHYSDQADQILVVQDGEGGSVELNGTNFAKVITTDKEFIGEAYPAGFAPLKAEYAERVEVIVGKDGRAYTRIRTTHIFQSTRYSSTPISGAKIGYTYYKNSLGYILLYDEQNHRIMGIQDFPQSNAGKILYAKVDPLGGNDPELTDLANMGNNTKLIYSGSYTSGSTNVFAQIIKKGDVYRIQKFELGVESAIQTLSVKNGTESNFIGNGIVSDATQYFFINSQYLFFGEGNKLYYYDLNLNQIKTYATLSGKVTAIDSSPNKDQIGVGLDNGEFHVFDVSHEALASGSPVTITKVENLGRVVDVQYKYGNYANFNNQK